MEYMWEKTKKQHEAALGELLKKLEKNGFNKEDLEVLLDYFANRVPLVVHCHISKHMEFFVKDNYYRNQFETGKTSGSSCKSSRTGWEHRMFDKSYMGAKHFERPKYGCINVDKNPVGVPNATSYGKSYMLLKNEVRHRVTFTERDSCNKDSSCGTLKYPAHVLVKFNDNELKAAVNASRGKEKMKDISMSSYKELQIHGPIEFEKDIEKLFINKTEINGKKNLEDMSKDFCKKNRIPYEMF